MSNGQRAYLSLALWTLLNYEHLALSLLKVYVYAFFGDVQSLFDAYLST